METKVWIVLEGVYEEGSTVIAVFNSRSKAWNFLEEKAKEAFEDRKDKSEWYVREDGIDVSRWEYFSLEGWKVK